MPPEDLRRSAVLDLAGTEEPAVRQAIDAFLDRETTDEERSELYEALAENAGRIKNWAEIEPALIESAQPEPTQEGPEAAPDVPLEDFFRNRAAETKAKIAQEESSYNPPGGPHDLQGYVSEAMPFWYEPPRAPDIPLNKEGTAIERETDEAYQQRADEMWKAELEKAKREGYQVRRYSKEPFGIEKVAGMVMPLVATGANAASNVMFDIPRKVAGVIAPEATENVSQMSRLPDFPFLEPVQTVAELGAMAAGRGLDARLINRVMRGAGATLPGASLAHKAGGLAAGLAADAAAREGVARLADAERQSRQSFGEYAPYNETEPLAPFSPAEFAQDVATNTAVGSGIGAGLGLVGKAALRSVNKLRTNPNIGKEVRIIEREGAIPGSVPPPALREAQRISERPAATVGEIALDPTLRNTQLAPSDIVAEEATDALMKAGERYREAVPAFIKAENKAYLTSPQGMAPEISMARVVQRLQDRIQGGKDVSGRPLPLEDIEATEELMAEFLEASLGKGGAMEVARAKRMGIQLDDAWFKAEAKKRVAQEQLTLNAKTKRANAQAQPVSVVLKPGQKLLDSEKWLEERRRLADEQAQEGLNQLEGKSLSKKERRQAEKDKLAAEKLVKKNRLRTVRVSEVKEQGGKIRQEQAMERKALKAMEQEKLVTTSPRKMSPAEIERSIKSAQAGQSVANTESANKAAIKKRIIDEDLLPALREERHNYPFNAAAPSPRGGFAGIKKGHDQRMTTMRDMFEVAYGNRNVEEIRFDDPALRRGARALVDRMVKDGVPKAIDDLIRETPGLAQKLQDAIAAKNYDKIEKLLLNTAAGQQTVPAVAGATIAAATGGPAAGAASYVGNRAARMWSSGEGGALRRDPFMQSVAGVSRKGIGPAMTPLEPPDLWDRFLRPGPAYLDPRSGTGVATARAARVAHPITTLGQFIADLISPEPRGQKQEEKRSEEKEK